MHSENIESRVWKPKKSFFKGVSKWLSGSSKSKKKSEAVKKEPSGPIPLDKDPKLVDINIVKTSAKEYDPSLHSVPTSKEIKAKLIAVDKYYNAYNRTQKKTENEKERPSWGYIMDRPLVEQYVLMNNYIRKASVIAELENIELEKHGRIEILQENETDTDTSLPSEYETELDYYKKLSLPKDQIKSAHDDVSNKEKKSLKKTIKSMFVPNMGKSRKSKEIKLSSSDSDPPIAYSSVQSFISETQRFNEGFKKQRKASNFKQNVAKNLKLEQSQSELGISTFQSKQFSFSDKSVSPFKTIKGTSIMKNRNEQEALKFYKEQKALLRKVSSPYVADSSDQSDDSFSLVEENLKHIKNEDFETMHKEHEYSESPEENEVQSTSNEQAFEQNKNEVQIKQVNIQNEQEFNPPRFLSPPGVLRKHTEEMVNKVISDEEVLRALTEKRRSHFSPSITNRISNIPKNKKVLLSRNDTSKFEPININTRRRLVSTSSSLERIDAVRNKSISVVKFEEGKEAIKRSFKLNSNSGKIRSQSTDTKDRSCNQREIHLKNRSQSLDLQREKPYNKEDIPENSLVRTKGTEFLQKCFDRYENNPGCSNRLDTFTNEQFEIERKLEMEVSLNSLINESYQMEEERGRSLNKAEFPNKKQFSGTCSQESFEFNKKKLVWIDRPIFVERRPRTEALWRNTENTQVFGENKEKSIAQKKPFNG